VGRDARAGTIAQNSADNVKLVSAALSERRTGKQRVRYAQPENVCMTPQS